MHHISMSRQGLTSIVRVLLRPTFPSDFPAWGAFMCQSWLNSQVMSHSMCMRIASQGLGDKRVRKRDVKKKWRINGRDVMKAWKAWKCWHRRQEKMRVCMTWEVRGIVMRIAVERYTWSNMLFHDIPSSLLSITHNGCHMLLTHDSRAKWTGMSFVDAFYRHKEEGSRVEREKQYKLLNRKQSVLARNQR